jgi:hypothetical protein
LKLYLRAALHVPGKPPTLFAFVLISQLLPSPTSSYALGSGSCDTPSYRDHCHPTISASAYSNQFHPSSRFTRVTRGEPQDRVSLHLPPITRFGNSRPQIYVNLIDDTLIYKRVYCHPTLVHLHDMTASSLQCLTLNGMA